MSFWDFLKNNKKGEQPITEEIYTKQEVADEKKSTGIYQLYSLLDRDNEQKGYDDALINPDSTQMDMGLSIIKDQLSRSIDEVKIYYEDFLREIDFHIESRKANAMVTTVEELTMKKEIGREHLEKVKEIELQCTNGKFKDMGMAMTYVRGFQKGLAAISTTEINKYHH